MGSENYGCWEVNNELAQAPEHFQGYKPNDYTTVNGVTENTTCPQVNQGDAQGTQTLATSYAVNARQFMIAMKQASPAAQIGVPWAFGSNVAGASVPDNTEWNNTVLGQDGQYISFVDAHYYPFSFSGAAGGSNPTDQQVLQSLMSVPSLYGQIRDAAQRPASRQLPGGEPPGRGHPARRRGRGGTPVQRARLGAADTPHAH